MISTWGWVRQLPFSSNEHQGSHNVWGTQLDGAGHYQPIDLQ